MTAAALATLPRAPVVLAGATRAELSRALAEIGVPEREMRMRAAQLWHWIYHRGVARIRRMRNIARPLLDRLAERHSLARPAIVAEQVSADGTRKWLLRMPLDRPARQGRRDRMRLHPGERPRHAVRLQPGRLHAQLHVLPHRHAELGAQPDRRRDRRPGAGRARPARRLSRRRRADRRARALRRGRARRLQHRLHGHGRAALQFRQRRDAIARAHRRRRPVAVEAAHHRLDLGRRAAKWRSSARECGTMLAVSLHATNDALRDKLVPLNKRYPIEELMQACRDYPGRLQRATHHLRICDAQRRQRLSRRGAARW